MINSNDIVNPILLLDAQEQTGEIFGSKTEHLQWSQAKQGSAGLSDGALPQSQSESAPISGYGSRLFSWAGPALSRGWTHMRSNVIGQLSVT